MIQELVPGEKEKMKLECPFGRGINFQIETGNVRQIIDSLKWHNYPIKRGVKDNWYQGRNTRYGCREILVLDPDGDGQGTNFGSASFDNFGLGEPMICGISTLGTNTNPSVTGDDITNWLDDVDDAAILACITLYNAMKG